MNKLNLDLLGELIKVIPIEYLCPLDERLLAFEPRFKDLFEDRIRKKSIEKYIDSKIPRILIYFQVDSYSEYPFEDDIHDSDCMIVCPRCGECNSSEEYFPCDYYEYHVVDEESKTDTPEGIFWVNCCDGRFIVDIYTPKKEITQEEAFRKYPSLKPLRESAGILKGIPLDNVIYWLVPVAFVTRVVDTDLVPLRTGMNPPPSTSQIRELIESYDYYLDFHYDKKLFDDLKLSLCHEDDRYIDNDKNLNFDLSLPVNSIDAFQPKTPYPKGMQLSHDGVYIDIECRSWNQGKRIQIRLSGD